MTFQLGPWIDAHKPQAGLGAAAAAVVGLAWHSRRQRAAAATAAASVADPAIGAAVAGGSVAVPGTTISDVQNAVQQQINDEVAALRNANEKQIAAIPRGATGATGAAFVPTMNALNYTRADQGQPLLSEKQYRTIYPGGKIETASEAAIIAQHAAAYAHAHAPRKPPPPAPKPKPKPAPPKPKPHLPAAPTTPKTAVKLIPPASKSTKK